MRRRFSNGTKSWRRRHTWHPSQCPGWPVCKILACRWLLAIVLIMIAPVPPFLLDVLISINIMVSVIVLLVSLYITRAVEFSVFPTTLLLMTLFRLALNISSSRAILLNGNTGTSAGEVIEAFGNLWWAITSSGS